MYSGKSHGIPDCCILILTVPLLIHEIIGRFGMKERFPEISGTFTVAFQILFVVITMCALPVVLAFVFRDMGKTLAVSMVLFFLMIFLMNGQHAESLIRILPMGQLRLIALQKFDRTTVPLSWIFCGCLFCITVPVAFFYMQI